MFNRSIKTLAGILALAIMVGTASSSTTYAQQQGTNQVDVFFANDAAWSLASEISLSQIAQQLAVRQETQQFAQRMINEHRQDLRELSQLASAKSIVLPSDLINSVGGAGPRIPNQVTPREQFDIVYLMGQIRAHEKALELFQNEMAMGNDAEIKDYATRAVPRLQEDLNQARQALLAVIGTSVPTPVPNPPQQ